MAGRRLTTDGDDALRYLVEVDVDWDAEFHDWYGGDKLPSDDRWWEKLPKKKYKPRPPFDPRWEIPGKLLRTSRPGYPERKKPIPVEVVDKWVDGAHDAGVRSIILLLDDEQLALYPDVPGGLVDYYRDSGFDVAHIPTKDLRVTFPKKWDPKKKRTTRPAPKDTKWVSEETLERAYEAYRSMQKPVLVHCSAGLDRSGQVVRYIKEREAGGGVKESVERVRADADLRMSSAEASIYLMEARFSRYKYQVPKDKEQQLYDFYIMGLMPDPGTVESGGAVGPEVPGKTRWKQPRPDIADAIRDVRAKLIPRLKKNLLNATYYAIAAETRHILDRVHGTPPEEIVKRVRADLGDADARRLANYLREYHAYQKYPVSGGVSREPKGRVKRVMGQTSGYDNSYRAAMKAFKNDPEAFARVSEWLFRNLSWSGGYGGKKWGDISRGWRWLHNANTYGDNLKYIDHVYDLQHNTDVMLNKVKSYAKGGGYGWLKKALDKKRYAQSPFHMYHDMSPGLRSLAAAAIKWYLGMTLEDYLNSPESGKASKTKGGYTAPEPASYAGGKKDYVPVTAIGSNDGKIKSLVHWYGVPQKEASELVKEAIANHGQSEVDNWRWPTVGASAPKTTETWAPSELTQGSDVELVVVSKSPTTGQWNIGTTTKHEYFKPDDKAIHKQAWMSAKDIGLQSSVLASKGQQPAQPKPAAAPKAAVKPEDKPVVTMKPTKGQPMTAAASPDAVDKTFVQMFHPTTKVYAVKGIRTTYGMPIQPAKGIVDEAWDQKFTGQTGDEFSAQQLWWPTGNYVTLGTEQLGAQTKWSSGAMVAFATNELVGSEGQWKLITSDKIKLTMYDGVWYAKATDVVNKTLVLLKTPKAPTPGENMVAVGKSGFVNYLDSLMHQGASKEDAKVAYNAMTLAQKKGAYWPQPAGTDGSFDPNTYVVKGIVTVALWNEASKSVQLAKLHGWQGNDAINSNIMWVRGASIADVTKQMVASVDIPTTIEAFPPVDTEGKTRFAMYLKGLKPGTEGPSFVSGYTVGQDGKALFYNSLGGAVANAADMLGSVSENLNIDITEFVSLDGEWTTLRTYDHTGKLIHTDSITADKIAKKPAVAKKPLKPGVMTATEGQMRFKVMDKTDNQDGAYTEQLSDAVGAAKFQLQANPDHNVVVEGEVFIDGEWKLFKTYDHEGNELTVDDALAKQVMAKSLGSDEPEEDWQQKQAKLPLWFEVYINHPQQKWIAAYDDKFSHWGQVQVALKDLKDNYGYAGNSVEVRKFATPAMWPTWHELDPAAQKNQFHQPSYHVETLEPGGIVKWILDSWKTAADSTPSTDPPWLGEDPKTREAAAELKQYAASGKVGEEVNHPKTGVPEYTGRWGMSTTGEYNDMQYLAPTGELLFSTALSMAEDEDAKALYFVVPSNVYKSFTGTQAAGMKLVAKYSVPDGNVTWVENNWSKSTGLKATHEAEADKAPSTIEPGTQMADIRLEQAIAELPLDMTVKQKLNTIMNSIHGAPSDTIAEVWEMLEPAERNNVQHAYEMFTGENKYKIPPAPSKAIALGAWTVAQAMHHLNVPGEAYHKLRELAQHGELGTSLSEVWSQFSAAAEDVLADAFKNFTTLKPAYWTQPPDPSKHMGEVHVWQVLKYLPLDASTKEAVKVIVNANPTVQVSSTLSEVGETFGDEILDKISDAYDEYRKGAAAKAGEQLQPTTLYDWTAGEVMKAIGSHPTAYVDAIAATALSNLPKDAPMSGAFPQFSSKTQANIKKAFRMMGMDLQTEDKPEAQEPALPPAKRPWNTWTVMQAFQLPLGQEVKDALKQFGGGLVLGEIDLPQPTKDAVIAAIDKYNENLPEPGAAKVYKIHDPKAGSYSLRIYKGGYADREDPDTASADYMIDSPYTYDSYEDATEALESWLGNYKDKTGDDKATGEIMHLATSATWDGPEEYVEWWDEDGKKTSSTDEWQASLQAWGDAGGHAQKADFPDDYKHELGENLLDEFDGELSDQSKMDISDHSDETLDEMWDALSGETQADLVGAINAKVSAPVQVSEPKGADSDMLEGLFNLNVSQIVDDDDLHLSDEANADLNNADEELGGSNSFGQVWGTINDHTKTEVSNALGNMWENLLTAKPDEPYVGNDFVDDLSAAQAYHYLTLDAATTMELLTKWKRHATEPVETTTIFELQDTFKDDAYGNIADAWEQYRKDHGGDDEGGEPVKPTKPALPPGFKGFDDPDEPEEKPLKPKPKKKPDPSQAMKALQTWKIQDALNFLTTLSGTAANDLVAAATDTKKQTVMTVWSLLSNQTQEDIINAWIDHKSKKQAEPKKAKKGGKAPTTEEAEKKVKTWKIAQVRKSLKFSDPYVDATLMSFASQGSKLGDVWDQLDYATRNMIVEAYIAFMKQKHGLEHVSAMAATYLAEARGAYPRIVRRKDHAAADGRDLYFVRFRADGKEYCYALGASLRASIDKAESYSKAKAASLVKAKSAGEYDCETGELKHREPKPSKKARRAAAKLARQQAKEQPPEVQTTLFDESAEASMYVLEAEDWLTGDPWDNLRVANKYNKAHNRDGDDEDLTEDVDRDAEATRMLDRYADEPTSIWLYTDMPVKDRVAWAYLAADGFKGVEGEDLVAKFSEALRRVVDDPETFWAQVREKDPARAEYLDALEWDVENVPLKDCGVYPRFSGFSDEVCSGNVPETAERVVTSGEQPEKVAKLDEMAEVWTTVLKFLPPILVPGGTLRGRKEGYEQTEWDIDDGNHRMVAAALAGGEDAVCFVGRKA